MKNWIAALILASALPAWSQSASLGRLFFTPEQRIQLDRLRQQSRSANSAQQTSYILNGEVRRSSGNNTRWVNGEAQTGPAPHGIIGDTYHPATGEQESLLGSGRITIQNPPAKP